MDYLIYDENNLFIHSNTNYNETSLNDLNVDGTYNQMLKTDYSQEPKVRENIEKSNDDIWIARFTMKNNKNDKKCFFLCGLVL